MISEAWLAFLGAGAQPCRPGATVTRIASFASAAFSSNGRRQNVSHTDRLGGECYHARSARADSFQIHRARRNALTTKSTLARLQVTWDATQRNCGTRATTFRRTAGQALGRFSQLGFLDWIRSTNFDEMHDFIPLAEAHGRQLACAGPGSGGSTAPGSGCSLGGVHPRG